MGFPDGGYRAESLDPMQICRSRFTSNLGLERSQDWACRDERPSPDVLLLLGVVGDTPAATVIAVAGHVLSVLRGEARGSNLWDLELRV
jgi:hypothetical protein